MLLPLLAAIAAVLLGAALGLAVGERALAPARAIAMVAALLAIFLQLIPEAVYELGWGALLVVLGAAAVPLIADIAGRRRGGAGLEIAYAGILVHQLADGVALGSLATVDHDHGHEVSYLAIAAHTVALAALFVLLFRERAGRVAAFARGLGMAGALLVGATIVFFLPITWVELAHPWVVAIAGGVLLHVALHPLLALLPARRSAAGESTLGPGTSARRP